MNRKKILEVVMGEFGASGLSHIVWEWYLRLDKEKMDIDFFFLNDPEESYARIIKKNNGKYCAFHKGKSRVLGQLHKYLMIKKMAKNGLYDCVHIHSSKAYAEAVAYLAVKKYCGRVIIHSHSSGIDGENGCVNIMRLIKKLCHYLCKPLLYGKNTLYFSCSEKAALWVFPKKICKSGNYTVLKNGVNTERFSFSPETREKKRKELSVSDKFVIGHIGRFSYSKNHSFLLEIFAEIVKKRNNAVLLLAGDGKLMREVKEKAELLKISDKVIFLGNVSDTESVYMAMDCFVFPSRFEGLGLVAVEAQCSGLPVVCSDVVPPEAAVTELCSFMPLEASPGEWAEHILKQTEESSRISRSEQVAAAGYDIAKSARQLEEIYIRSQ